MRPSDFCDVKIAGTSTLITGCSRGIGRALVIAFASVGAHVFATARNLDDLADLGGDNVSTLKLDVTDTTSIVEAVACIPDLGIVVNNAGYGLEGAIEEVTDEELREVFDTNVFGVWRVCREVLPVLRQRGGGTIVNISSFGGIAAFPGIGAYRASKFALEGLTATLRLEAAQFGIRVISVEPGAVATDFGTRSLKHASLTAASGPYAELRAWADDAYDKMCPETLAPEVVADAIVREVRKSDGPGQVAIGQDAKRIIALAQRGQGEYERYLVETLGLKWGSTRSAPE